MLTFEFAEEVFIRVVDLSVTKLFPLVSCRSDLCSSSYKRFSEDSLCCAVSHELLLLLDFFLIFITCDHFMRCFSLKFLEHDICFESNEVFGKEYVILSLKYALYSDVYLK
jgi:hypothetical protein